MFNKIEFFIANKYVASRRKESFVSFISWFSLIGIALGVAVLIIVMSVMNGFRKEIIQNLIGTSAHITISSYNNQLPNYDNIINNLKSNQNISFISSSINKQVLLSANNTTVGSIVSGLSLNDVKQREIIYKSLAKYNLKDFEQGSPVIFIGRVLANNLKLKVGDSLTIIFPNGYSSIVGSLPKFGSFKVIGIINTQMYQYDSSIAIVPFSVAQSFFNLPNLTQNIEIFVNDKNIVERTKQEITTILQNANINTDELAITTWQDTNRYFINSLEVERNVMFLILTLVILIAAFNIVSSLTILVKNKTKEIAILQTMGLSQASIIKIFLFIGLRIGIMGTFFGCVIGVLFATNIQNIRELLEKLLNTNLFVEEVYFLSKLPSDLQSFQVILIVIIALLFSLFSAIYPAIKASKIKPAEGLKYD
jgi:lipoprotein-releasing system permease protein